MTSLPSFWIVLSTVVHSYRNGPLVELSAPYSVHKVMTWLRRMVTSGRLIARPITIPRPITIRIGKLGRIHEVQLWYRYCWMDSPNGFIKVSILAKAMPNCKRESMYQQCKVNSVLSELMGKLRLMIFSEMSLNDWCNATTELHRWMRKFLFKPIVLDPNGFTGDEKIDNKVHYANSIVQAILYAYRSNSYAIPKLFPLLVLVSELVYMIGMVYPQRLILFSSFDSYN